MSLSGVLILHKPSGMTSRRAVDLVQRLVRPAKVGHAGTLDPLASGVLVVCVGQATRLIEYVQRMRKYYSGSFLLGRSSDTEDIAGNVIELIDPPRPSRQDILRAAASMVGRLQQRPPAFSALKVGGRRAYDLARAGQQVELAPREVAIYRLDVIEYEYPTLTLDIECGGGTYIRSLGRDLADSLGAQAVMASLVRRAIGEFRLENAIAPDSLTRDNLASQLAPPGVAVADLPTLTLEENEVRLIGRGMPIDVAPERLERASATRGDCLDASPIDPLEWAAIDASGRLAAIVKPLHDGRLSASKNFAVE